MSGKRSGVAVALILAAGATAGTAPARGEALDPLAFASLGAFPTAPNLRISGTTLTAGGATLQGVVYNGISVFTFDAIDTAARISIDHTAPVALLSRTGLALRGETVVTPRALVGPGAGSSVQTDYLRVTGPPGVPPPIDGSAGIEGGAGGGSYAGRGEAGGSRDWPFGSPTVPPPFTVYIPTSVVGGAAGAPYFDPANPLKMGSPGGRGTYLFPPYDITQPGGGALELGAVGAVTLASEVNVDGSPNRFMGLPVGGGGGSGGSIYVHGASIDLTGGTLSAQGGNWSGSFQLRVMRNALAVGQSGAGGGGAVVLETPGAFTGGPANFRVGNGVATLNGAPVPEPSSVALVAIGLAATALAAARARRRA